MSDFELTDLEPLDRCPADRESADRHRAQRGRTDGQRGYRRRSAKARSACLEGSGSHRLQIQPTRLALSPRTVLCALREHGSNNKARRIESCHAASSDSYFLVSLHLYYPGNDPPKSRSQGRARDFKWRTPQWVDSGAAGTRWSDDCPATT
jgi:hypothetical protein